MNSVLKIVGISLLSITLTACFKSDPALEKIDTYIAAQKTDTTQSDWKTNLKQPEQAEFDIEKDYFWDLKTNHGDISIKLFEDIAPMHVTSTIYLTRLGFYDDLIFHRVIPGFMAQGGDPLGSGRGNPGYKYAGEFDKKIGHSKAGMLSMANAGPGTDGSQFFITFKPTPFLNGRHTVFGEVVKGLDDTLVAIEKLGSQRGKTQSEIKIIKANIRIEDAS